MHLKKCDVVLRVLENIEIHPNIEKLNIHSLFLYTQKRKNPRTQDCMIL